MSPPRPVPVQRLPAETQATDSLRNYILESGIAPGAQLPEVELAEQLNVSRATLRTALHRLNAEGLIDRHPYRGWAVTSFDRSSAWELWTLRGSLERLAAEMVVEQNDPEVLDGIQQAFTALEQACEAGDLAEVNAADLAFHRSYVRGSGHRLLLGHYGQVENQIQRIIQTTNSRSDVSPEFIVQQHQDILDALMSGDAHAAGEAAWEHSISVGKRHLQSIDATD